MTRVKTSRRTDIEKAADAANCDSDDDDVDSDHEENSNKRKATIAFADDDDGPYRNPPQVPPTVALKARADYTGNDDIKEEDGEPNTEDEFRKQAPLCCAICTCSNGRKARVLDKNDEPIKDDMHNWISPADGYVWHRRCCHGQWSMKNSSVYATPYLAASKKLEEDLFSEKEAKPRVILEYINKPILFQTYDTAKNQEAEVHNNDSLPTADTVANTSEQYQECQRLFNALKDNGICKRKRIVVLDCFGGIGTAELVLKRLGVAIDTVVFCENDQIARHVYDCKHNNNSDTIRHIYIDRFEDLYQEDGTEQQNVRLIETLLHKTGEKLIDLVIGGPPCVDYSAVNAYRQGVNGKQGKYLVNFGKYIKLLKNTQRSRSGNHNLFFLAENTVLREADLCKIREAFGVEYNPFEIDGLYFGPTRRRRMFLSNIPLAPIDYTSADSSSTPRECLEKGYVLPSQIVEPNLRMAKANCLMASTTRIDERNSLRMYCFKTKKEWVASSNAKEYAGRPYTIQERENLMGFPPGYVKGPVYKLFHHVQGAIGNYSMVGQKHWSEDLDESLHQFAGNYHKIDGEPYRFVYTGTDEYKGDIKMKMAPIPTGKSVAYYTDEEYAKHLIGNSFSVPVLEHLLRPLTQIYKSQNYGSEYEYRFKWRP